MILRSSSMVRNSRMELSFLGFSFGSSCLNGLRSISPSLTAFVNAVVRRFTKIRQVVALNVFLPLLKVHVLKKAMKPLQKSLSISVKNKLGLSIINKVLLHSGLSIAFQAHTLFCESALFCCVLVHPLTECHLSLFHALPVHKSVALDIKDALPLICSASFRVLAF